ncbi:hypothetical protein DH2020_025980 [Rehmannia glutinosa]|uniref:SAWADEE domain-containing protein n=1 Tax=Rehmannia glutinosa TaxID=99300 RepID=A0ABR0W2K2_REHGL
MADGGCNNSAGNDVVELEAMRKGSFSWHPCQVSLCSKVLGLVVEYGENYPEEMISDKQEVLARVRVRSTPLQGDDCSSLQEGNHVLATQSSHVKGVFYDAQVEKTCSARIAFLATYFTFRKLNQQAIRVRHSKRIHCRCSFTIKWLHQPLEEEALTVPASAIMKLSTKSIDLHPIISTFFSMLESSNVADTSLCSRIVDSMNWEMDINVLLEKQIEEISNSTDVSRKISKNFVFGLEVDLTGEIEGRTIEASLKEPHVTIPLLNNIKCSTGSENKQPVETIMEISPSSIPSIQEEFSGSRLPLNPLAARAALASLKSKFPQSAELSVQSNVDCSSNADDFTLKISATLEGRSPNFESIAKTLFPSSIDPQIVEFPNVSSGAQVKGTGKKNKISEKKVTQPSETRVTRSRIQRNNRVHESTQINDTIDPQNCLSDNQKLVTSPVDGVTSMCSAKYEKSLFGKDKMIVKVDSDKGTFAEDAEKHIYPKRLTRSVAGETEKNNLQPKLKSRKSNLSESNELDLSTGNAFTESNRIKTSPKTAENNVGSSRGITRRSASSKKQETRFSPRLKLLSQTRSQTKA